MDSTISKQGAERKERIQSDNGNFYSSRVAYCGGNYRNSSNGGVDHLNLNYSPTSRSSNIAPRLKFSAIY